MPICRFGGEGKCLATMGDNVAEKDELEDTRTHKTIDHKADKRMNNKHKVPVLHRAWPLDRFYT